MLQYCPEAEVGRRLSISRRLSSLAMLRGAISKVVECLTTHVDYDEIKLYYNSLHFREQYWK